MGLSKKDAAIKRAFDFTFSFLGLMATWWLILIAWILSTWDTKQNGLFLQERVGQHGKVFKVIKIRTMKPVHGVTTTVTQLNDARITPLGAFFRKWKIDELPQLINVLLGQMSFVGPRPDVPGFADQLDGEAREVLSIKPGITGPATLKYRNEEELLSKVNDPDKYNRDVIFPDKVRINLKYIREFSLQKDIQYIWQTIRGS